MSTELECTNPPLDLIPSGELGEELIVLAHSELRRAELLDSEELIETDDGVVKGSKGDYKVYTPGGEPYPVKRSIFLGAYEIRGDVSRYLISKRLIQPRRAWPIVSLHAEFRYAGERGTVAQTKGAWIYRTDENDFGLINRDENYRSHSVVGTVSQLRKYDWGKKLSNLNSILISLPPILSLLGLLAFASFTGAAESLIPNSAGNWLLALEGLLLLLGVMCAWWSKREEWVLRAAFQESQKTVQDFQVATELLGETRSKLFPSMTIWRAAQSDFHPSSFNGKCLSELKTEILDTISRLKTEIMYLERREHLAETAAMISAITVIFCILALFKLHAWQLEAFIIWLPSLIGAFHSANNQYQVKNRITSGKQFINELEFIQRRLHQWSPQDNDICDDRECIGNLTATLRLLCRVIGEYSQHQIGYALDNKPGIPI